MDNTTELLSPQQQGLIVSAAEGKPHILNHYKQDCDKKIAPKPTDEQLNVFVNLLSNEPHSLIRRMNSAISWIHSNSRRNRYVNAALELELIIEHLLFPSTGDTVSKGIPSYLPDGYTDMGHNENNLYRKGQAKIRFDKKSKELSQGLIYAKKESVEKGFGFEPTIDQIKVSEQIFCWIKKNVKYDNYEVDRHDIRAGAETVVMDSYKREDGFYGVCRQMAIWFQMMAQTAGLDSTIVKGNKFKGNIYSRHAWNKLVIEKQEYVVDTTTTQTDGSPHIILRSKLNELLYEPTEPELNCYKIKWGN